MSVFNIYKYVHPVIVQLLVWIVMIIFSCLGNWLTTKYYCVVKLIKFSYRYYSYIPWSVWMMD